MDWKKSTKKYHGHLCDVCKKAARLPLAKNEPQCSLPEDVKWGDGVQECEEFEE